ncbi:hypothetical protein [Flavivirga sp. 57AJ16]|uniref:hypothetical protein n=1 Tax=Flavivirga sp. 57AJ16 TaxID=3025307 RepID=UPI00236675D6|nr:hypothetical protein [Flavivirga sp. 57AJ16]MDD7885062.1 hypothetical protein [Flavivirga sp. 57AJ16]
MLELQSGDVEDGCKIVIFVVIASVNAMCFIPEPSVSKAVCAAAKIMNAGAISDFYPNSPNLINDAGVKVCQLTSSAIDTGIKYTFEFGEKQTNEINNT